MKVKIGAEAALFPEKEYINGIAVAVHGTDQSKAQQSRETVPLSDSLVIDIIERVPRVPQDLHRVQLIASTWINMGSGQIVFNALYSTELSRRRMI
jgi:hypothetical protein